MRASQNELCLRRGTTQTCVCEDAEEGSEREMAQLRRGSEKEELIRVELAGKGVARPVQVKQVEPYSVGLRDEHS